MAIKDASVRYFDNTMTGAPALSGTAGTLIGVLDACLVNGFGAVNITSIVVSDNIATVTCQAAHNLALIGSTGPVVRISGVDSPAALNGDWRVATIPSGAVFTFQTEGIAGGGASGASMAFKRAPAGWEIRFSGTNRRCYGRAALDSTAMVLRVIDDGSVNRGGYTAGAQMYESMSDVNTGVAATPAAITGALWWKSDSATGRQWRIISDGRLFHLIVDPSNDNERKGWYLFGDISELTNSADVFGCIFAAATQYGPNAGEYCHTARLFQHGGGRYIARGSSGSGESVSYAGQGFWAPGRTQEGIGSGGFTYESGRLHVAPVFVADVNYVMRGTLPGVYMPLHTRPLGDNVAVDNIPGLTGRTLLAIRLVGFSSGLCEVHFDITGPWR